MPTSSFSPAELLVGGPNWADTERIALRRAELEPLVTQAWMGLNQIGLAVLTPGDPDDRAGIVAIACPKSEEIKRHLIERGIYTHGDDGRVRAAIRWYTTAEQVDRYLGAIRELLF